MAGEEDTCTLLVQGLSADISRDALELHIEDMTGVEVTDVTYMVGKTEAIVKLEEIIRFDNERPRTISGKEVKIVSMRTRRKLAVPVGKPTLPVGKPTLLVERAAENPMVHSIGAIEKPVVPGVIAVEKPKVPEDRGVDVDDIPVGIQGTENFPKEKTKCVTGPEAKPPPYSPPKESSIMDVVRVSGMRHDLLEILLPDLESSLPDCSLKIVAEGIELNGAFEAVNDAKFKISEQVFNFKSQAIPNVDSQRARLLQSDKSQHKVQVLFSNARIQAVLSVRDDQLLLTATDSHQHSQASRILERNIHRSEITLEDFHQEFLQSADFKQFTADLERNYTVAVEKGTSTLVVDALGDCSDEVQKQVHDKLEDNAQHSDDIHLTEEDWNLLNTHHQAEVKAIGCKSAGTRSTQVTLTRSIDGKGVIHVSGDPRLVKGVKTDLTKFVQQIVHKTVKHSIPGLFEYMSEGHGNMTISGIQNNCKTVINVMKEKGVVETSGDMEEVDDPVDTTCIVESYREKTMAPKVTLEVIQGDLTTLTADVLVNTPSGKDVQLAKCGVVSKAFCKVGGQDMQELYDEVSSDGEDVIVTPACGNLKCQHVFHMRIHRLKSDTYQQLEDQIYRCLQKASELGANSIAFPTIGCGNLHYEYLIVVECIDRAIKKHETDNCCEISKVILCAYSDDMCEEFEELLALVQQASTGVDDDNEDRTSEEMSSNLVLEVQQGDLTTFKVDVLVNTPAAKDKELTKCGQVCRAFCNAGGEKMQELYEEVVSDDEDLMVTQSCGTLNCKHVFHMRIQSNKSISYQKLEDHIYRCLQKASELHANSIAFPTIGCGKLGYKPRDVAQCFKHAIKRHGSEGSCSVTKVIVVAYSDDQIYQHFVQTLSMPRPRHSPLGKHRRSIDPRPPTPKSARKGRRSLDNHSVTLFHICALSQSDVDNAVKGIDDTVNEYSSCETVPAQYLDKFSQGDLDDVMSLSCDKVRIITDKQAKCFSIVGAKDAASKTAVAVTQKVQAIEERPDFVRQARSRAEYLDYIHNRQFTVPAYWKSVTSLHQEGVMRVKADPDVATTIRDMVQCTWIQQLAGTGSDAKGLTHNTIDVITVEQIENQHLYMSYEHKKKEFCARAVKDSFKKVTSDPDEKDDVMTSKKGSKWLDDQLIPEINEYFLFHGAPQQYIEAILKQGIDFRLNTRAMFGKGAYFCESSTKADQYADDRKNRTTGPHSMFLCKVILGCSHIAKKPDNGLVRPPCLHHCKDSCKHNTNEFHDSVMGTHRDNGTRLLFREFIVYERSQIYPAFLITYNRK